MDAYPNQATHHAYDEHRPGDEQGRPDDLKQDADAQLAGQPVEVDRREEVIGCSAAPTVLEGLEQGRVRDHGEVEGRVGLREGHEQGHRDLERLGVGLDEVEDGGGREDVDAKCVLRAINQVSTVATQRGWIK